MRRILYAAPVGLDKKQYESNVFVDELLKRLSLVFAGYDPASNRFGIVSGNDPSKIPQEFLVTVNSSLTNTVDINPGTAVFANGEIIVISSVLDRIPLADGSDGATNVMYLQFSELDSDIVLTRYNAPANTTVNYLTDPKGYVISTTLANWQSFTTIDLATKIPLAVVNVASGVLYVDLTKTTLATNRPWFSAVDIEHRSKLGTGVVTDANAHGLSLNDISATSGKTLYQLLLDTGMIVAKDISVAKIPGHICSDIIPSGAITQDASGAVTGIAGAWYFYLSKYPVCLLRTTISITGSPTPLPAPAPADASLDLAGLLVAKRNMVVVLPNDALVNASALPPAPYALKVTYIAVTSLQLPTDPLLPNTFSLLGSPSSDETIIAGGAVPTNFSLQVDFNDAGPFPSLYTLFMISDGFIYKTPQCLFCNAKLVAIGTSTQNVSVTQLGPAVLRVGLTGATSGATLNVVVRLTGTDAGGATLIEDITYNNTWVQDIIVPEKSETNIQNSAIYKYTTNLFYTLKSVQVTNNVASGANASISVWAALDPVINSKVQDMLPIADVVWDGLRIAQDAGNSSLIEDVRPIGTKLAPIKRSDASVVMSSLVWNQFGDPDGTVGKPVLQINHEDFEQPKYLADQWVETSPVWTGSKVPTSKYSRVSKLHAGLGRKDFYVSRPIGIIPHFGADALALYFVPSESGRLIVPSNWQGFSFWARVFCSASGWSSWYDYTPTNNDFGLSSLGNSPSYLKIDLKHIHMSGSSEAQTGIVMLTNNAFTKYQFCVQGPMKHLFAITKVNSASSLVNFDPGLWNDDSIYTMS